MTRVEWLVMAMRAARKLRDVGEVRRAPRSERTAGAPSKPPTKSNAPETRPEPPLVPSSVEGPNHGPRGTPPALGPEADGPQPTTPEADEPEPTRTQPPIPLEKIDRDAIDVVRRLRRSGYQAYLVGGCVRDLLIGLEPKDFDVSTNAKPEEIRRTFRNCRIVGRRFRLAHVYFRGGKVIETSTFRASATEAGEGEADLLIRHDNVFGTERQDALRRDFTINALFYDVSTGTVVDHVGGLVDLEHRQLRMIGDPEIRLREDPVRIIRAVRIAAKTEFEIEETLSDAMDRHKADIHRCPKPRVSEEILKLFRSGHAEASYRGLERTNVLGVVLPRYAKEVSSRDTILAYLAALDARVARGGASDTLVLAALAAPFIPDRPAPKELFEGLEALAVDLGATRRATESLRHMFLAQRHFSGGRIRKGRATPPEALARRGYFLDALDLFELRTVVAGGSLEEIESWRSTARLVSRNDDEESASDISEPPGRPRRRRRRR
ncbi:MAG: polynucleotide adenylyltransferase PcnB [Deltaproteobacteria bacterium]|nr:polynucleotide adenylyltransferase PcnB [Deltaproteobacteria bacterium]